MTKDANLFFKNFRENMLDNMFTAGVGRIVKVDLVIMKADVTLLTDPDKPLLKSVPISAPQTDKFVIRMPYRPGDIVTILFSTNEIDDTVLPGVGEKSVRRFSASDGIITGGIKTFDKSLPGEHSEDLVIASKFDFSSKIVITKDDDIIIKAKRNVYIEGDHVYTTQRLV